jgi:hypothetical protein
MRTVSPVEEAAYKREFSSQRARTTAITLYIACDAATIFVGNLLLALRHPANTGPSSKLLIGWVEGVIDRLKQNGFPALAAQCEYDLQETLKSRKGE